MAHGGSQPTLKLFTPLELRLEFQGLGLVCHAQELHLSDARGEGGAHMLDGLVKSPPLVLGLALVEGCASEGLEGLYKPVLLNCDIFSPEFHRRH